MRQSLPRRTSGRTVGDASEERPSSTMNVPAPELFADAKVQSVASSFKPSETHQCPRRTSVTRVNCGAGRREALVGRGSSGRTPCAARSSTSAGARFRVAKMSLIADASGRIFKQNSMHSRI